jgi:U6 snRNA-associated Sm-like protein LSm1
LYLPNTDMSDFQGESTAAAEPQPALGSPVANKDSSDSAAYLPGAASLIEEIDKRIMIILRDGRHLVGRLRSFDQFMNLILEDTCERVLLPGKFCDVPLGLYIVRGDTIVLLGEVDPETEEEKMGLQKLSAEEMMNLEEDIDPVESKLSWDFE